MSTLTSLALAVTLLACPALGAVPAEAADPADASSVAVVPSVELGPVEIVMPTCTTGVYSQQLTTDRHGVSTTAWQCESHVYASRTLADGTWSDPVDLAPGYDPVAVADRRGRVTVAFRQPSGDGVATRRWSRGTWRPAVEITLPTRADRVYVEGCHIAGNARGDIVVTWRQKNGEPQGEGRMIGIVAAFRPFDSAWTPTAVIPGKGYPDMALMDGTGHAAVLDGSLIYHRGAAGRWHDPAVAPIDVLSGAAENADGDLLLTDVDSNAELVFAYERPSGAAWLPPVQVGTTARRYTFAPAVLDGLGRAAIAYPGNDGSARVVTRTADGIWGTDVPVSPTQVGAGVIRLVSGPQGALAVSWVQRRDQLWASIRPPGGDWSAPVRITPPRWHDVWHPQVSFRPDGALVAAWSGQVRNLPGERVAARVLTPVAPRG